MPDTELSELVGPRVLAWVGGAVTLLGIVFFFVLAVNRGWVSDELRVGLGAVASACLYGAGWWIHRRMGNLHGALAAAGAGIAGAYVTLFAAAGMYDLIPESSALVAGAAVAVVGVATALAWNGEITALLGLAGAMLGPVILESGDPSTVGALYVAAGFAAAITVANRRGWLATLAAAGAIGLWEVGGLWNSHDPGTSTLAAVLAGIFVLLYLAGALAAPGKDEFALVLRVAFLVVGAGTALWVVSTFEGENPPWGSIAVAAVIWLAYFAAGVGLQLHGRAAKLGRIATALVLASVSLAFIASFAIWDGNDTDIGVALLVVAAVTAAPLLLALRIRGQRDLWTLLWAASLAVLAVAVGHLLGGEGLVLAWAAQGALAAWVAVIAREERLQLASAGYLALAAGHTLIYEARPDTLFERTFAPENGIPAILFVAAGAAVAAVALYRGRLRPSWGYLAAGVLSGVGVLYAASFGLLAVMSFESAEAAITTLWAAAGLAVLLGALVRRSEPLHWIGIALFAASAAKLWFFDLETLSAHMSGWSLLGFGLIALAAGYAEGRSSTVISSAAGNLRLNPWAAVFLPVSAVSAGVGIEQLLHGGIWGINKQGVALLALGAVYGLLAATVFGKPGKRDLTTILWALGATLAAIGFADDLLDGQWLVLAWAALGAALAVLGRRTREERFLIGSLALVGAALLYAVGVEAPPDTLFRESATPASGVASLLFAALGIAALAACLPAGRYRRLGVWVAGAVALFAGSLAILGLFQWPASETPNAIDTAFQRGHTAVSAAWVLVGLALLAVGLVRGRRSLRLGGLALFGLALVKIFVYDLANLSSLARAFSFLAVGGVLLVAALLYQRLTETSSTGTARPE